MNNLTSQQRHASWLELFYDLVFVVAVSALSLALLTKPISLQTFGRFILVFVPIWWTWMGFSYYADQVELKGTFYRTIIFSVMFLILILASTVPNAFHGDVIRFVILYMFLRTLLIGLYIKSWLENPFYRQLLSRYIVGGTLGLITWAALLFYPSKWMIFFSTALTIEIATPVLAYLTVRKIPAQISHMDERFGLFTLIVLGETIISVALGFKNPHWTWFGMLNCISAFFIAACMWIFYFDSVDENVINRALRGKKSDVRWSFVYGYSHVLIFTSIVAFGVAVHQTILHQMNIPNAVKLLLIGSAVLYLLGVILIQNAILQNFLNRKTFVRLLTIFVMILLIIFLKTNMTHLILLILAAIFGLLTFAEKLLRIFEKR